MLINVPVGSVKAPSLEPTGGEYFELLALSVEEELELLGVLDELLDGLLLGIVTVVLGILPDTAFLCP